MRYLLPLFFCLSCFAQPSPINRRAMVLSRLASSSGACGGTDPTSVPGLAYRWRTNNVLVGVNNAMTNWIDEIQGLIATNSGTFRPTLTSTGVYFGGAQVLTNMTAINSGQTLSVSMFAVISRDKNDTLRFFTGDGISHGHFFDRGIISTAAWEYEAAVAFNCSGASSHLPTNSFMTLIHDATHIAGGSSQHYYTNGLLANTIDNQEAEKVACIGGKAQAGQYLSGTLLELCFFTNIDLNATYVCILSNYSKTTYGTP